MKYPRETPAAVYFAASQLSDELARLLELSSVAFYQGFEDSFRNKQKEIEPGTDAEYANGFVFGTTLWNSIKRKNLGTTQD